MGIFENINWQLIAIIAATSAAVSYLGDKLGKKIGKKRISLFGIRPKFTSITITMLTGVVVAIITLIAASVASRQVYHAFFGVNYLSQQISDLTADVRKNRYQLEETQMEVLGAQQELDRLREEKNTLEEGLSEMKEKRVVVFGGEMLAQIAVASGSFDGASTIDDLIASGVDSLRTPADPTTRIGVDVDIIVSDAERERAIAEVASSDGRKVLRLIAASNTVAGQPVEGVIAVFDSRLIYSSGELLLEERFENGSVQKSEAPDVLYRLLRRVNRDAVAAGILPDPLNGAVGGVESSEFYSAAESIVELDGAKTVEITAAEDIYTEGPVRVRMIVRGVEQ